MVTLKNQAELDRMREAGRVVGVTLKRVSAAVEPGISLTELEAIGAAGGDRRHEARQDHLGDRDQGQEPRRQAGQEVLRPAEQAALAEQPAEHPEGHDGRDPGRDEIDGLGPEQPVHARSCSRAGPRNALASRAPQPWPSTTMAASSPTRMPRADGSTGSRRRSSGPSATASRYAAPSRGVVSAADPRAAAAGVEMLRAGGTATDAAIATMLALNVVEPQSSGIGGGSFWVTTRANGEPRTIDARETAPSAADKTAMVVEALDLKAGAGQASVFDAAFGFCARLGIEMRLSALGVPQNDLGVMADDAFAIRRLLDNNPRDLSRNDILSIYKAAF